MQSKLPSFVWGDEGICDADDVRHRLEANVLGAFAFEGTAGHFSLHHVCADGTEILARDLLGVHKLFYAVTDDGVPVWSNFWFDLLRAGWPASSIWSVPMGCAAVFAPGAAPRLVRHTSLTFGPDEAPDSAPEVYASTIRARLEKTFRALRESLRGRPIYISLSGGLDSSVVAALAREHIGDFTALTFAVDGNESEDLASAEKVARHLGVPWIPVTVSADDVLSMLDVALLYGQDWREFNVHCALVNAAVGRAIQRREAASGTGARPVLLTGDVMNELMTDYTAVEYGARDYYTLPDVGTAMMRRLLVNGLDAGDREVGVFWNYGVEAIQPYALCANAYTALPVSFLEKPGAKQALVWTMLGDRVPPHVYLRPKTRAQEGSSSGGGTLSICADRGIDETWLKARFAALYDIPEGELHRYLRSGHYRCSSRPSSVPPPPVTPIPSESLSERSLL
jgi:asparagine synthetase B (glutamine-hydrolysing)